MKSLCILIILLAVMPTVILGDGFQPDCSVDRLVFDSTTPQLTREVARDILLERSRRVLSAYPAGDTLCQQCLGLVALSFRVTPSGEFDTISIDSSTIPDTLFNQLVKSTIRGRSNSISDTIYNGTAQISFEIIIVNTGSRSNKHILIPIIAGIVTLGFLLGAVLLIKY